jgi:hypothetical protein
MMRQGFFTVIPPETEKLSQLRSKTDRQILDFIHSKLDLSLDLAAQAEAELAEGDRASAQELLGRAERSYSEAQKLLLALSDPQRRGLDRKVNEVVEALERVCQNRELLRPLFFIARSQSRV